MLQVSCHKLTGMSEEHTQQLLDDIRCRLFEIALTLHMNSPHVLRLVDADLHLDLDRRDSTEASTSAEASGTNHTIKCCKVVQVMERLGKGVRFNHALLTTGWSA